MRGLLCMIWLFCASSTFGAERARTHISSFVHQITLTRDSTQTRLTQWVAPIRLQIPIAKGNIQIRSAAMIFHQDATANDQIWGATNTDIQGQWAVGKVAHLSLHASIPTGKHALSTSDATLAQNLFRNDLNFPVKTFGQGLDYGGTFSLVRHRGFWTWSAGFAYQRKGAYEPLTGVTNYKPGDVISGSIGFDYTHGSFVYRLSAAGTYYLTDRQNNLVVFQNGKQILLQGAIIYTAGKFKVISEITEIARLKNQALTNGAFLYETRDSNGNDLRGNLEISFMPTQYLTLYGTGYAKHLTANAHPANTPLYQGDAYLIEGGGGVVFSFGPYHINLRATKMTGKAEDKTVTLSAFNIHGAFTAEF
jgi:hypothetical protein